MSDSSRILAPLRGVRPQAPVWFDDQLLVPMERRFIDVDSLAIEVAHWGRSGATGVLFLHGSGANLDWWRFIAPFFAGDCRVATLSFSGMGNSAWSAPYGSRAYCRQAMAAARACGLFDGPGKPVVVGHSLGGAVALLLAHEYGRELGGAAIVDAHVGPDHMWGLNRAPAAIRYSATQEEVLARFRFAPPQPCENLFIADFIARTSSHLVPGRGWTWKHDPALVGRYDFGDVWAALADAACPLALIRGGESGLTARGRFEAVCRQAPAGTPAVTIAGAHHHVMVDKPLELVEALQSFLAHFQRQADG